MATGGVLAIGECMLELSGGEGDQWRMGFAGDTFNALWTMRALLPDRACDYASAFGDDPFSQRQIAFFRAHGIGVGASRTIPGARPGLYAISLDGAERSFTYWRSDAAARQLAKDPDALAKSLENRALVYFSGITLAILDQASRQTLLAAISDARAAGARIAFDPNYRPRLWASPAEARAAVDAALTVADIALPTFPDEQALYGDATPQASAARMRAAGVAETIVKNGAEPAFAAHDGGEEWIETNPVSDAVDTTGAGDGFNGAYLAGRLLGDPPTAATVRAHRVAAAVVRVRGALAPFDVLREAFSRA